jgi:uncharacterized membrane protein
MKLSWRSEIVSWVMIAGMFILAAVSWRTAPDAVPIHWNAYGQVDGYAGKAVGLLLIPAVALIVYLVFLAIPRIDPSRTDYSTFGRAYAAIRFVTLILLAVVYSLMHLWFRGYRLSITTVMPLAVGGMFIVIGNYMGKIRQNWFFGIRTPWTLTSRHTWTLTNRMGGWVFIGAGLLMILSTIFLNTWVWIVLIAAGIGGAIWTFVYSYLVWRKAPDRGKKAS